jgi:hypothetical protein
MVFTLRKVIPFKRSLLFDRVVKGFIIGSEGRAQMHEHLIRNPELILMVVIEPKFTTVSRKLHNEDPHNLNL